jgi:hypothetical protein
VSMGSRVKVLRVLWSWLSVSRPWLTKGSGSLSSPRPYLNVRVPHALNRIHIELQSREALHFPREMLGQPIAGMALEIDEEEESVACAVGGLAGAGDHKRLQSREVQERLIRVELTLHLLSGIEAKARGRSGPCT